MSERVVAFLCGSIHPGRDGVGDYSRLLASELEKIGQRCLLVGLAEPEVFETGPNELALPVSVPWSERIDQAAAWLDDHGTTWLSLQLVPWPWHPRGLLHLVAEDFARLGNGRKRHVFAHELWLGHGSGDGLKHRLLGLAQRDGIIRTLRAFRPHRIDTSNPVYERLLQQARIRSEVLPLFANVPSDKGGEVRGWPTSAQDTLRLVHFGTVQDKWNPDAFFGALSRVLETTDQRSTFLLAGHPGYGIERLRDVLKQHERISLAETGPLAAEDILPTLGAAHWGINSSPRALCDKSGSIRAMRAGLLPVVVPRDDYRMRSGPTPTLLRTEGLFNVSDFLDHVRANSSPEVPPEPPADAVAKTFLDNLLEREAAS